MFTEWRRWILVAAAALISMQPAFADWHQGKITGMHIAPDGTVVFSVGGWSRSNCGCSVWQTYMCLDRSRASFREEFAMVTKARTLDEEMNFNIDEGTCKVTAVSEGT